MNLTNCRLFGTVVFERLCKRADPASAYSGAPISLDYRYIDIFGTRVSFSQLFHTLIFHVTLVPWQSLLGLGFVPAKLSLRDCAPPRTVLLVISPAFLNFPSIFLVAREIL